MPYSGGALGVANDRYLQNAAYLRLKNLTVGYTIPISKKSSPFESIFYSRELILLVSIEEVLQDLLIQKWFDASSYNLVRELVIVILNHSLWSWYKILNIKKVINKWKVNKYIRAALLITNLTACDSLLDMSPEDTMSPETYFSPTRELETMDRWFIASWCRWRDWHHVGWQYWYRVRCNFAWATFCCWWKWLELDTQLLFYKLLFTASFQIDAKTKLVVRENDGVAILYESILYYVKVRRYGMYLYDQVWNSDQDELFWLMWWPWSYYGSCHGWPWQGNKHAPSTKSVYYVTKWTALALKTCSSVWGNLSNIVICLMQKSIEPSSWCWWKLYQE